MDSVTSVTAYNNEMFRRTEINRQERRIEERRVEERNIKHQLEVNEQARMEMNRRMNRSGQNVDKLA